MKIVHLGKYYAPASGGIETHVQALARAQAARGHGVRVVCVNHLDAAGRDVTYNCWTHTRRREDRDGEVRITRLGRKMCVKRLDVVPRLPHFLAELHSDEVDVVHLHTPNPTMLFAAASLRSDVPLVITHHSDIVKQRLLRYAVRPFERVVYGRASLILSTSDAYVDGSPTLLRFDKVATLPLGLDLSPLISPSAAVVTEMERIRAMHAPTGEPLWLGVGRCVYYKGFSTAVAALRDVPGKLVIVGEGPLRPELERLATSLGVADRLIWWGRASDDELAALYRTATALWFPSNARSEAFGLVQVEAMAAGCPVINAAIKNSGVPWVSPHEQTGLTVPINNAPALAAAARRLIDEPGLRDRLSRAAVERAANEFGVDTMAARSIELYGQAIARYRKRTLGREPAIPSLSSWVHAMARGG